MTCFKPMFMGKNNKTLKNRVAVLAFLADHPSTIGKDIASATGISEPDVSKTLTMLKSMAIVTSETRRTKEGKNYTGKYWCIVHDVPALKKILPIIADTDYESDFLNSEYSLSDENEKSGKLFYEFCEEQQQKIIVEINRLVVRHFSLGWGILGSSEVWDYFRLINLIYFVVPKMFPTYIDPRKITDALLSHDKIFQFQRLYYDTRIAPYVQAIEDAKTVEEMKKATKEKEEMKNQIFDNDFRIPLPNTGKMKDYTTDERV